jgi:hypothetical protein
LRGASVDNYTAALRLIDLVAAGNTIRAALQKTPGITRMQFKRMVAADPNLQAMYAEAVECFKDANFDLLLNIDDDPEMGRSDPKMAAVISKNIQFALGALEPDKYGPQVKVTHNVTASQEIIAALTAARARAEGTMIENNVEDAVLIDGKGGEVITLAAPTTPVALVPLDPGESGEPGGASPEDVFSALARLAQGPTSA